MDNVPLLICGIILMVALSAFFSATETAYSSLNRVRLKNMATDGNRKAAKALKLSENYDKLLSSILIGNNIVNIAAASLGTVLFTLYFHNAGVTISTAVMTIVVLIFGEVSPKSMAKEAPESFAMAVAPAIHGVMVVFTPLTFLFSAWKGLLSRMFKVHNDRTITEDELITIVDEAESEGGIDTNEGELIRSAIEFNDMEASDILTPRVDLVTVEDTATAEEISRVFHDCCYSRLPVYHETVDHIVGALHEKDFFCAVMDGEFAIEKVLQNVVLVTETVKISTLLRLLQNAQTHMAVVVDEFGGTAGIVTLEDILEELVGEIWDEHDQITQDFRRDEEGNLIVEGGADLEDVFELLQIDREYEDISTVNGWIMQEMGRIPNEGDSFDFGGLRITATKVNHTKVLEARVQRLPQPEQTEKT